MYIISGAILGSIIIVIKELNEIKKDLKRFRTYAELMDDKLFEIYCNCKGLNINE